MIRCLLIVPNTNKNVNKKILLGTEKKKKKCKIKLRTHVKTKRRKAKLIGLKPIYEKIRV